MPKPTITWACEYDAALEAYSDGASVTQLTDQSGNARHATQATSGNQALFDTASPNLNGLPAYVFDGINDFYATAAFTLAQPITIVAIGARSITTNDQQIVCSQNAPSVYGLIRGSAHADAGKPNLFAATGSSLTSSVAADSAAHIYIFQINGASSEVRLDGTSTTGTTGTSGTTTGFAIGRIYTPANYLKGDWAYIAVKAGTLTTTEKTDLEAWFASEFGAGDVTAPVLTSPVGTATGSTTATIGATTDEGNGTLYGVVTVSATAPSAAQVKAGQDNTGAAATFAGSTAVSSIGDKTISATGLTAATAYYAHLMHEDAATNQSNIVSSAQFTTSAAVVKGARVRLFQSDGATPQASLTGLTVLWWDAADPDATAPDFFSSSEATDASGWLEVDLSAATSLALAAAGWLLIWKRDATNDQDSLVFAGELLVEDIAT